MYGHVMRGETKHLEKNEVMYGHVMRGETKHLEKSVRYSHQEADSDRG